jgi:SAM-dependent methyltransferase
MGISVDLGKPQTLEWFENNQTSIKRILDIGVGSGTYINLIKLSNNICFDAEWVAIEAWKPYIDEFKLESKYNRVVNTDARKLNWDDLGKFDVAIAGDVLEHMSKDEAITLVDQILENCKTLIISIPIRYLPQDEINGNPFEVHVKDDWSHEEVLETWPQYIKNFWKKEKKSLVGVYWLWK